MLSTTQMKNKIILSYLLDKIYFHSTNGKSSANKSCHCLELIFTKCQKILKQDRSWLKAEPSRIAFFKKVFCPEENPFFKMSYLERLICL